MRDCPTVPGGGREWLVGVNMAQGLVSSRGAADMLVTFGEYRLQVEVVKVTLNNKGCLRVFSVELANGSMQFLHGRLSISIRRDIRCSHNSRCKVYYIVITPSGFTKSFLTMNYYNLFILLTIWPSELTSDN